MIGSWHNHTQWSDGLGTVVEMVGAAQQQGLAVLGISDHLVIDPAGIPHEWTMDPAALAEYTASVRRAAHDANLTVLCGVEADYIPETVEETARLIAAHDIDFVVASVHFVDGFPIDSVAGPWQVLTEDEREEVHRRYWTRVREMAERRFGDIAAHLDLTKKFGFRPRSDLTMEIHAALDALARADMIVEINTAGWHKPCDEAYPSLSILRACRERTIPIMINADAHEPAHLLRDFARAEDLLRAAGYTQRAVLTAHGREFCAVE